MFVEGVKIVDGYNIFDGIRVEYQVENVSWIVEMSEQILELEGEVCRDEEFENFLCFFDEGRDGCIKVWTGYNMGKVFYGDFA